MSDKVKKEKIFLNAMDSWFSNFIIETFRTDHLPDSKLQTEFMGTINDKENFRLPLHFKPQIFSFDYNPAYKSELFSNDIFIYNLNTGNLKEVEYLLNGLKSLHLESEKLIILISNIMTWANTPNKKKSDNPDEVIFVHPDDARLEEQQKSDELKKVEDQKKSEEQKNLEEENNEQNENKEQNNNEVKNENNPDNNNKENNNEQENKETSQVNELSANNSVLKDRSVNESRISKLSKLSNKKNLSKIKEENENEDGKQIYVYWTEKDYLHRKAATQYIEYKYIENEALLLNHKINIKSYVVCPGVIYGFGEETFYSIFRSALLGFPIEEILLDKGRNIIPTIHMKDLINIISKIIEKKPISHYILAFDQTKNRTLTNIIKSIYYCIGDIKIMHPKKEEIKEENGEKEENEEKEENNEEKKEIIEEKEENNEENEEKKEGEESEELKNTEIKIHPFFSNKKYIFPDFFPKELLYLDVKLLPSDFLKGEPKERYYSQLSSGNEDEKKPIQYNPLFKWHCQNGIISNIPAIRKEFVRYRNLNSNKIFILGNPYTGKTTISKILSKIFHLPIIDTKSIVDFGKRLAGIEDKNNNPENNNQNENNNINENKNNNIDKTENEYIRKNSLENDLIRDIKKTMKELEEGRAEAEEAYNKRPNKKKTDPPFDDHMYYRFNDDLMVNILKRRLEENDSYVYGFICDGFPKNYSQAKELFKIDEKNIANPNSVLIFENIEDDYAINRLKTSEDFPKDPKDPNIITILERANRRLARVKEEKTTEGYKSINQFFEEEENKQFFNDKIKMINGKNTILDIIKDVQEFIIKNNDFKINHIDEILECTDYEYDYIKIEEDKNKPPEEQVEQKEENTKKEEQQNQQNKNININIDNIQKNEEENKEKDKSKKNIDSTRKEETIYEETKNSQDILNTKEGEEITETKEKEKEKKIEEVKKPKTQLEIEKENEFKLLEKKSEVLRRYLAENVLPLLSLGILHVATKRPDDPVEALADYLLAKTFETKKNDEGELDENIKEENNENDNEEKSFELNLEGEKDDDIKLNLGTGPDNNGNKDKLPRNLSPIHRENSNGENIEDVLNKGMMDTDE